MRGGGEAIDKNADFNRSINWKAPVSKHDRVTASIRPAMVHSHQPPAKKFPLLSALSFEKRERGTGRNAGSIVGPTRQSARFIVVPWAKIRARRGLHGEAASRTDRSFLIVIVMRLRTALFFRAKLQRVTMGLSLPQRGFQFFPSMLSLCNHLKCSLLMQCQLWCVSMSNFSILR